MYFTVGMCVPRDTSVLREIIIVVLIWSCWETALKRQTLATREKYHISCFFPFLGVR